ncbi:uncharacterized protein LOC107883536 isoform X1 [Acyrthosiphon pisum]|uniref:Uncharacterized protein n=2 Tax=Acyrthosiphon pisum TaxID=7029 RepID=A0A8R2H5V7_ACYPI|nr:uncharacterized protein LOC107883536 isoform X1 [Acyrthosiphon pisum]|eukprot:XP_016659218.1 PREDICTED: uncharacterized protein LOC107883536 isoform X1 [Acyrthosiphon pisum]
MNYDTSSETSNDEIVSIHNAYKKEFCRLSKEHQCNLNSLEECYKEQILCIIKEKDSVSLQLLSIFQSLYEHFQQKLKKLKPKNDRVTDKSGEKIDVIDETYQCIINGYENKQQDLFKEILELKKIIMEEKKININVSSIGLLDKENSILKSDLNSNESKRRFKSELITGVLIWCLGVIAYQKKSKTSKENSKTEYLLELVLVITMIWHLGKFGEDRRLGLLNLVICGIICCTLGFF